MEKKLAINREKQPKDIMSSKGQVISEYNMGVLEFERLNKLFMIADEAAMNVLTGNIKAIFSFYGALRLIRIYLISRAKHLSKMINEADAKTKRYISKLDRLLKQNKRVPIVEKNAIQSTLDYYSILFWVKDILGYGIPFRRVYSDEEQIKKALGID